MAYDSKEEQYFEWYCEELKYEGVLNNYFFHQESFDLIPGFYYQSAEQRPRSVKKHTHTLAQPHGYMPDFLLIWNQFNEHHIKFIKCLYNLSDNYFCADHANLKKYFYCQLQPQVYSSYIDIKPMFTRRDSDVAVFMWKRALMLEKHKTHVQAVVIQDLFKKTFTPQRFLRCDVSNKQRKINWPVLTKH
jgi:hypothetical protein